MSRIALKEAENAQSTNNLLASNLLSIELMEN